MTKCGRKQGLGKFPRNDRVRQQWHLCLEPLTAQQSQLISREAVKWRRESYQNVKYAVAVSGTNSSTLSFAWAQDSLKQETLMWFKGKIYVSERKQIICELVIREPAIILSKKLAFYKVVPEQ